MSWFKHHEAGMEDSLLDIDDIPIDGNGPSSSRLSYDALLAQNKQLSIHLDSERAAHEQSKAAAELFRKQENGTVYKLQQEAERNAALSTSIENLNEELRTHRIQRANLETALNHAQDQLQSFDRNKHAELREASSTSSWELERISKDLNVVQKKLKTSEEGEKLWKAKAETEERERIRFERALETAQSSSTSSCARSNDGCSACVRAESELRDAREELQTITSELATLKGSKQAVDANLLHLTNQHAALERSAQRDIEALRDELESTRDDLRCAVVANEEVEQVWKDRFEEAEKHTKKAELERDNLVSRSTQYKETLETLHAEIAELEKQNDDLRRQPSPSQESAKTDDESEDLRSSLRSLEIAFQARNSDLLSSRAALTHTETKLVSLSARLDEMHSRSYTDEYVLSLKAEMEDEIRLKDAAQAQVTTLEEELAELSKRREATPQSEEVEILEHQHKSTRAELAELQKRNESIATEKDNLSMEVSKMRVGLSSRTAELAALQDELAAAHCSIEDSESRTVALRQEISSLKQALETKDEELESQSNELESLKRDARALRDQLLRGSPRSTPSPLPPSSRRKHHRANSAPFSPSPLRNASFPPLSSSTKEAFTSPLPTSPTSRRSSRQQRRTSLISSDSSSDEDGEGSTREDSFEEDERIVLLVARLRDERNEACEQLQFYLLEHQMAVACEAEDRAETMQQLQQAQERLQTAENRIAALTSQLASTEVVRSEQADIEVQAAQERRRVRAQSTSSNSSERDEEVEHLQHLLKELQGRVLRRTEQIGSEQAKSSQLQMNLSLAEETISELEKVVEGLEKQLAELQSQRIEVAAERSERREKEEELRDQLSRTEQELRGASNLVIELEKRASDAESLAAGVRENYDTTEETNKAELKQTREELEGARNLALQLEGARSALLQETVELRSKVDSLQQDSAEASERYRTASLADQELLHTTQQELEAMKEQTATERHDEQARTNLFILTLIDSGRLVNTLRTTIADVSASHQETLARVTELEEHLAEARKEMQAAEDQQKLNNSRHILSDEEQAEAEVQQNSIDTLIVLLVQASRQSTSLQRKIIAQSGALQEATSNSAGLEEKVIEAERTIVCLEDAVARYEEEQIASALEQQEVKQLRSQLESLHCASVESQTQLAQLDASYSDAMAAKEEAEAHIAQLTAELDQTRLVEQDLLSRLSAVQQQSPDAETLRHDLTRTTEALQDRESQLAEREALIEELKESLRMAEEEGKNLVQDFNMLSEEFERKQQEDEARALALQEQERKLETAMSMTQELTHKSSEHTEVIRDYEERVKRLEEELESKQLEIEETDDRYLDTLKTIKKQEIALDKLKVRIEALQRANVLLTKAVPASVPDVLAPQPASAKKRGLPQEFVAPDPGPRAIVTQAVAVSTTTDSLTPRRAAASETLRDQENAPTSAQARTKSEEWLFKPIPASDAARVQSKPRKPLSSVSVQPTAQPVSVPVSLKQPSTEKLKPAGALVGIKTVEQPAKLGVGRNTVKTAVPAVGGRPNAGRTGSQDPKSLLAALQALKRNTA